MRLEIPSFVLSEKRIVTVILARGAGGYLMNAIILDQQGAATQALNASARARVATSVPTPVDVAVNGTPIAAGLASPNVGPYVARSRGTGGGQGERRRCRRRSRRSPPRRAPT